MIAAAATSGLSMYKRIMYGTTAPGVSDQGWKSAISKLVGTANSTMGVGCPQLYNTMSQHGMQLIDRWAILSSLVAWISFRSSLSLKLGFTSERLGSGIFSSGIFISGIVGSGIFSSGISGL